MKFVVFIVCWLLMVSTIDAKEWQAFKNKYGKNYATKTEDDTRLKIYLENKLKIEQHNRETKQGKWTFTMGLNKYADLLHEEFLQLINLNTKVKIDKKVRQTYWSSQLQDTPDAIDWRASGCVREPIDQGQLGCSYPSVSTGALEGQWCSKHHILTPLSEQNLLDCVGNCGSGASTIDAYQYCLDNAGVDTEESYPYTGDQSGTCKYQGEDKGVLCNGVVTIPKGNESLLEQAVGNNGPVSVTIDASNPSFQLYASGVYYEPNCSSDALDHLLLVVGYNSTNEGQDYWIARNSWGTSWGEDGYVLMSRNRDNNCGVATAASYPRTAFCRNTSFDHLCNNFRGQQTMK